MTATRQPPGVPTGGQFVRTAHDEGDTALEDIDSRPPPMIAGGWRDRLVNAGFVRDDEAATTLAKFAASGRFTDAAFSVITAAQLRNGSPSKYREAAEALGHRLERIERAQIQPGDLLIIEMAGDSGRPMPDDLCAIVEERPVAEYATRPRMTPWRCMATAFTSPDAPLTPDVFSFSESYDRPDSGCTILRVRSGMLS